MTTLTDEKYRTYLVKNILSRNKNWKAAMVHFCECWEIDEALGIMRVRLRDGIDRE